MIVEWQKQTVRAAPAEDTERGPMDAIKECFNNAAKAFNQNHPDSKVVLVEVRLIGGKHG